MITLPALAYIVRHDLNEEHTWSFVTANPDILKPNSTTRDFAGSSLFESQKPLYNLQG